jgi:hypothetical protein
VLVNLAWPLLLHLAPFWLWSSHVRQERIVTATVAIHQALNYQSMLRTHGKCVSEFPGWNVDSDEGPGVLISQVKVTGTRLKIECDQKERKFSVSISFPRDDFGYIEGGFDGPAKIVCWRDAQLETKVISKGAVTETLAKLLAFCD